jgi:hypothetical protein
MTSAELLARAHARAHDEHIYIRAVPNRPGYYTARSRSLPRVRHSLVALGSDVACSCAGFYHRRSCKHVEALRNRLAREGRRYAHPLEDPALLPAMQLPLFAAAS